MVAESESEGTYHVEILNDHFDALNGILVVRIFALRLTFT